MLPNQPLGTRTSWIADSALGFLAVQWSGLGIARISFEAQADAEPSRASEPSWLRALRAYFDGKRVDPASLPVQLHGTAFQRRVWTALRTIRRGTVSTYGQIAEQIGCPGGARAVGMANAANPIAVVVPCHRVVAAGGSLGGYSAGLRRKRHLLALEGAAETLVRRRHSSSP